jgi:hypothetical protein
MQTIYPFEEPETAAYFALPGASGDWFTVNEAIKKIKYGSGLTLSTVSLNGSFATNLFLTRVQYTSTGLPTNDGRWWAGFNLAITETTHTATTTAIAAATAEELSNVLNTSTCGNNGYSTFDGATATGFHAIRTSGNCAAGTAKEIHLVQNALYKLSATISLASGALPQWAIYNNWSTSGSNYGLLATMAIGSNVAYVSPNTATATGTVYLRNTTNTEYTVSQLTAQTVTAPDSSGVTTGAWTLNGLSLTAASYSVTITHP